MYHILRTGNRSQPMLGIDADISQPAKDTQLSLRIPSALKKQLRRMARGAKRTLGDYVTLALEQHVEEGDRKGD